MKENQQCPICKHYALYHMPIAKKTICASCIEKDKLNTEKKTKK